MMRRMATINTLPPDVDGMGYKTDHIQGGGGFSYTRYASKELENKVRVLLVEKVPSPFDRESKGITSDYSVWVGLSDSGEYMECPYYVPAGATSFAPDGEVNWFAKFGDDGSAAEAFAISLEVLIEDAPGYKLAISENQLNAYFRPAAASEGLLEKAQALLRAQRSAELHDPIDRPRMRS